jgi:hypothetical protein
MGVMDGRLRKSQKYGCLAEWEEQDFNFAKHKFGNRFI